MANPVTKPTNYVDWAMLDRTDPTSGVANTAVPSVALQNYGPAYRELLARQHFNWLHRLIASWVRWLEGEAIDIRADLAIEVEAREDAIDQEVEDRTAALVSLSEQITTYVNSADGTLQDNIDDEETAREDADTAINNLIQAYDNDTTDVSGVMELEGFAANQNMNFYAQILRHRASNVSPGMTLTEVLLSLPETLATSTDTALTISQATIPVALRPTATQCVMVVAVDNGTEVMAVLRVSPTGDWVISKLDDPVWFASGSKGLIGPQLIRYQLSLA